MLSATPHLTCLALARPLFGQDLAVTATDPNGSHDMMDAEAASLPPAVPNRVREFAAGRAAARMAMAELGAPVAPVLHGKDRAPVWPNGLQGSISHCKTACLAVVGRVRSLGVDVEEAQPLPPEAISIVCSEREQDWLQTQPKVMSRLIFSAKESAYKAQYEITRSLFGFETFEMTVSGDQFQVTFQQDVTPFNEGDQLTGRFAIDDSHIVTAMTLRA